MLPSQYYPKFNPSNGTYVDTSPQTVYLDEFDSNTTYVGLANLGANTNGSIWLIKKISILGSITSITYADGNAEYDNIWDNRYTYSYN